MLSGECVLHGGHDRGSGRKGEDAGAIVPEIMAKTVNQRMHAKIEGDFVVFIIGMRINKIWKIHKWFPVFIAMPKMIVELSKNPESGFLGARQAGFWLVQYWRSFDHLVAYSRNRDGKHFPAWVRFNKKVASNGDVGIWHETFLIKEGQYETLYNNMPAKGLGKFGELVPAKGKYGSAMSRAGKVSEDEAPIAADGSLR